MHMVRGGWAGRRVHAAVVVADGDDESRAEVVDLLGRLSCMTIEAASGAEALAAVRAEELPALVILDVSLPDVSGYAVCRELRDTFGESLGIMFLSDSRIEADDEVAGLLLGADEYLVKPVRSDLFLARVRRLLARSPARPAGRALTPRELEVLALLVQGRGSTEIAAALYITEKTTGAHIEHILAKLGAHSRAQAVAFAVRDQLVGRLAS
jgi:two-component system, NarL family, nitrate/nitrite response regulator NarL